MYLNPVRTVLFIKKKKTKHTSKIYTVCSDKGPLYLPEQYCSTIHDKQDTQTAHMPITRWRDKEKYVICTQ